MHECPVCQQACDCDQDDMWNDAFDGRQCLCDCEQDDPDDDYGDPDDEFDDATERFWDGRVGHAADATDDDERLPF